MAFIGSIDYIGAMFDKSLALQTLYKYLLESLDSSLDLYHQILKSDNDRIENRIDLGFGMIAIEQSYKLNSGNFESHKKYIDFQLMIKGDEYMECGNIDDFSVSKKYDENNDVIFYHQKNEVSKILLKEKNLAVFFPYDVHRGGIGAGCDVVHESGVKVPYQLLKYCF